MCTITHAIETRPYFNRPGLEAKYEEAENNMIHVGTSTLYVYECVTLTVVGLASNEHCSGRQALANRETTTNDPI